MSYKSLDSSQPGAGVLTESQTAIGNATPFLAFWVCCSLRDSCRFNEDFIWRQTLSRKSEDRFEAAIVVAMEMAVRTNGKLCEESGGGGVHKLKKAQAGCWMEFVPAACRNAVTTGGRVGPRFCSFCAFVPRCLCASVPLCLDALTP
jgi:hypothetical protein